MDEKNRTLDLLTIPSWDDSGEIYERARRLSYTLGGIYCLYVNEIAMASKQNKGPSAVFLNNKSIEIRKKITFRDEPISFYDLSMKELLDVRKESGQSTKAHDGF